MPRWIEWIQAEQEYGTTMPVVPRIERPPTMPSRPLSVFARERLAAGNGDLDLDIGSACRRGGDFGDRVGDHPARHRIDRRLARRNRQARPGHRADALAGAKASRRRPARRAHRRDDQRAMRHVGIVAGILDHAGASPQPASVRVERQRKARRARRAAASPRPDREIRR